MGAREHERRARHRAANPERRTETPRERGFARTELAVEGHDVARAQLARDPRPERRHGLGRSDGNHHHEYVCTTRPPMRVTIS